VRAKSVLGGLHHVYFWAPNEGLLEYLRMTAAPRIHVATIEAKRVLRASKVGPKRDQKMFCLGPNAEFRSYGSEKN
jgi:hypothetical protein